MSGAACSACLVFSFMASTVACALVLLVAKRKFPMRHGVSNKAPGNFALMSAARHPLGSYTFHTFPFLLHERAASARPNNAGTKVHTNAKAACALLTPPPPLHLTPMIALGLEMEWLLLQLHCYFFRPATARLRVPIKDFVGAVHESETRVYQASIHFF